MSYDPILLSLQLLLVGAGLVILVLVFLLWRELRDLDKATDLSGFEYEPPLDRICPYCGAKHQGPWRACSPCKAALDSGDSR